MIISISPNPYDNTILQVFVYGTLIRGKGNSYYLDNSKFLGEATISGFRLYDTGYGFPGIKYGVKDKVKGEVYKIESEEQLQRLDSLEGNGSLYSREFTNAHLENGDQKLVITYVYKREVNEMNYVNEDVQPWVSPKKEEYVWYACYGSNLSYDRFMKYINDDRCDDKTPPSKWLPITIKHDLYFAREASTWDDMAVAFLNPEESENANTLGRMYLIKLKQYLQVKELEGSKYRNELCLGYFQNRKIVSFTDIKVYPSKQASKRYLDTITIGLLETYPSLSDEDASDYLKNR